MYLNKEITILEACEMLKLDLFTKTTILTDFILTNYGENTYKITLNNAHSDQLILKDPLLGDTINLIKLGSQNKIGQEAFIIYHESLTNKAKAFYQFYSNYNNDKFYYNDTEVFSNNFITFIRNTIFKAKGNEIIEKHTVETKVENAKISKYQNEDIKKLIHHINNNNIEVISSKKKVYKK